MRVEGGGGGREGERVRTGTAAAQERKAARDGREGGRGQKSEEGRRRWKGRRGSARRTRVRASGRGDGCFEVVH